MEPLCLLVRDNLGGPGCRSGPGEAERGGRRGVGPPAPQSPDILRSLGLRSLVFAPCGNAPEHGDFLSVMRDNLAALRNAVQDNPHSRAPP